MAAPLAVVTGAGRRLGFEVCEALLDRGYQVVALYRTATPELETLASRGATTLSIDLARADQVEALLTQLQALGPLALLVNNASEFTPDTSSTAELAVAAARLMQINAIAPLQLMAGLADSLRHYGEQSGRPALIVNITDIFVEKPNPRFAAYCASKAALSNLTLSYARQLAPHVRVNALMPGPVKFLPSHTEAQIKQVLSETLLAREGGFQSVVMQLLALVDNDYMTGALIPVDGGRRLA